MYTHGSKNDYLVYVTNPDGGKRDIVERCHCRRDRSDRCCFQMLLNVDDDHVDGDETDDQKEEKPNDFPRPTHVANVEISPAVQTCFRTKFEEDSFLNHFDFVVF